MTQPTDVEPSILAQAFELIRQGRTVVLNRLPQDLLEAFDVEWFDGDFQLHVRLQREPTETQLNHLNLLSNHALTEFRARLYG